MCWPCLNPLVAGQGWAPSWTWSGYSRFGKYMDELLILLISPILFFKATTEIEKFLKTLKNELKVHFLTCIYIPCLPLEPHRLMLFCELSSPCTVSALLDPAGCVFSFDTPKVVSPKLTEQRWRWGRRRGSFILDVNMVDLWVQLPLLGCSTAGTASAWFSFEIFSPCEPDRKESCFDLFEMASYCSKRFLALLGKWLWIFFCIRQNITWKVNPADFVYIYLPHKLILPKGDLLAC